MVWFVRWADNTKIEEWESGRRGRRGRDNKKF
jgi:hypothetical protein